MSFFTFDSFAVFAFESIAFNRTLSYSSLRHRADIPADYTGNDHDHHDQCDEGKDFLVRQEPAAFPVMDDLLVRRRQRCVTGIRLHHAIG